MTDRGEIWGARRVAGDMWRIAIWTGTDPAPALVVGDAHHSLSPQPGGWHAADITAQAGTPYGFAQGDTVLADPAARQLAGDVDSLARLTDITPPPAWQGRPWHEAVILEVHVGTFTTEGTLRAAADRLPALAEMGITAVELMPLGQFPGARGWGYDGVLPFALHPAYGTPADMTAFVAAAHAAGIMVIVDVVYNHFGPKGAVVHSLCPSFFDADRQTPWGPAIALDRPPVADFFLKNATMWLRDYGVDGLRLDAVHQLGAYEDTTFLEALAHHIDALALDRPVHLIAEDERNLAGYVTRPPYRAQWNDDYHHAVHCLLTGESHTYYAPFSADPMADLVTALREGQVDQGQVRPLTDERRGEPSGHLSPLHFVNANQTHDQIGNRAMGDRLIALAGPDRMRVMHAMLLLCPFVPMLFMGEEEGARAPFRFFTDFDGDLAQAVRDGRRAEFAEFADAKEDIPDPNARATFESSRPYASPAADAGAWRALTRDLLALRRAQVMPLLHSGWTSTDARRLSETAVRAEWRFTAGALSLTFALDDACPPLPAGHEEIFAIAGGGVTLCVGTKGRDDA